MKNSTKQTELQDLIIRIEKDHSECKFASYREYVQELDQATSALRLLKYDQFDK